MKQQKTLIFGAAGSIGSELYRQCVSKHNPVFGFDIDEARMYSLHEEYQYKGFYVDYRIGDIRNKESVVQAIENFQPDIIFHVAAYKNVIPMEKFPREAVETNILGTLNIFEAAQKFQRKVVYISSDKAVTCNNVMGWTKRGGELFAKSYGFVTVRFGNVLSSRGSCLETFALQVSKGEPITITDLEAERYFMSIPQAAGLVLEAAEKGKRGETWILDMGEKRKIIDVKKELYGDYPIKIIGLRPGETLSEQLMTPYEKEIAKREGKFFILS